MRRPPRPPELGDRPPGQRQHEDGRRQRRPACKGKPIAALSFTATNYAKLALRSDRPDFKWANNDAGKRWLADYFNARIAHECKGAKGARLFARCRGLYVAEEKARLREGAAKLRADEDGEDSSTGSEDASKAYSLPRALRKRTIKKYVTEIRRAGRKK